MRSATLAGLTVLVVSLAAAQTAAAATLKVPQQFPTIQDAEDAAAPGDLIKISPGTYNETVDVATPNLRFLGAGTKVIVDADGGGEVFDIDAAGITLENLRLRDGAEDGVECDHGAATDEACKLIRVTIEGDTVGDCLEVDGGTNALVRSSHFVGCDDDGIDISAANARVERSVVRLVPLDCIEIDGDGAVVDRNFVQSCGVVGLGIGDGVNVDGNNPNITRNRIRLTDGDGFQIDGDNPVVRLNRAESIDTDNFVVDCSGSCGAGRVERNSAIGSTGPLSDGFDIGVSDGDDTFRIAGNLSIRRGSSGFNLDVDDVLVRGNRAARSSAFDGPAFDIDGDSNLITGNLSDHNAGEGFSIDGDENVLTINKAEDNQQDGFLVENGGNTDNVLERNLALRNRGIGINNSALLTDVIRNKSTGSGEEDCDNSGGGTVDQNVDNKCADGTSFS